MIKAEDFKKRYLYFKKDYINNGLCNYLNIYKDKMDTNNLKKSLERIFPYIVESDSDMLINYINESNIEYSNRIKLILQNSLFSKYMETLPDEKIEVDLTRLNFTKNFIYQNYGKIKKHSEIQLIDVEDLDHMKENGVYFYNFDQILNKTEFINNIMNNNKIFKYLIHQDIHNSIINPILVSIMLTKYFKNKRKIYPSIFQLDIKQIYKYTNKYRNKLEILYFIKEYSIFDQNISDVPIKKKIDPFLIIKLEMNINENDIELFITY